ncbi:MAG: helix-turn-helix domain-containing protein [Jatrophihabitans sp.]
MATIRSVVGETLRASRLRQRRTLREVSAKARVSLGYLSEIERGQKEASSELLAAICEALDLQLSEVFAQVSDRLRREERLADRARLHSVMPAPAMGRGPGHAQGPTAGLRSVSSFAR